MYDVIIVGARCAGASLAMLLARRGAKVLLVDRATFPSDIPHGHFIHRDGPRRLSDWGLLDRVATRTPAITAMLWDAGDFPLRAPDLVENGIAWGYGPRRKTLDKILIDAAVEGGAELREAFNVSEYVFDGDRIVGIRSRGTDGRAIEERATITVGADGRNSHLARAVQAPVYNHVPAILGYYFGYWSGVETDGFELYVRGKERRVIFSFKTEDHLYAVFVGFPMDEFPEMRCDIEGGFMRSLELAPEFCARIRAGRREERFYGASDLPNFYRTPYGAGWALVGDAAVHKDPYLALGICDALRDVEFLANAIEQGLAGTRPMTGALMEYEARRNTASAADYSENVAAARFTPPPPELLAVRAAIRHKPHEATRLVKARAGMVDPAGFFNPQNMQRLLAGAETASL